MAYVLIQAEEIRVFIHCGGEYSKALQPPPLNYAAAEMLKLCFPTTFLGLHRFGFGLLLFLFFFSLNIY